jgi:Cu/Ag efflux protein CusF
LKLWKAIVLVNLALALGLGLGYLRWGREEARLRAEIAALAARPAALVGEWTSQGVVRAVLPDLGVIVLTHGAIGDAMPAMTMGFRVSAPTVYAGLEPGDEVRFTARGAPPNLVIVRIEKLQ